MLSKNRPTWRRPKAEDVAKHLGMRFLYSYGYDYASTHVHPMANDGILDFFIITKLKRAQDFPDQRVLLSNTVLTGSMIVQQALNASTLAWRVLLFDFLDELRRCLEAGDMTYRHSFTERANCWSD